MAEVQLAQYECGSHNVGTIAETVEETQDQGNTNENR